MKYFNSATLFIAALISSTLSFADPGSLSQYYSTKHPQVASKNTLLHPNTDITVINATSSYIYAVVPGAINDYLESGI